MQLSKGILSTTVAWSSAHTANIHSVPPTGSASTSETTTVSKFLLLFHKVNFTFFIKVHLQLPPSGLYLYFISFFCSHSLPLQLAWGFHTGLCFTVIQKDTTICYLIMEVSLQLIYMLYISENNCTFSSVHLGLLKTQIVFQFPPVLCECRFVPPPPFTNR